MSDEKKLLTKLDLYERYWKCRDFEINNLWQRSIFLGPILALTYTGYGVFFLKCFVNENGLLRFLDYPDIVLNHMIAIVISLMGVAFSILWIYMMKGSKAWYEVYERAVIATDTQKGWVLSDDVLDCCGGFKFERLPGYKNLSAFMHGNKEGLFDDKLFSTCGGLFSPSKINIVIGQVSLVFWFLVILCHVVICFVFWIYEDSVVHGFHMGNKTFICFGLFALAIAAIISGIFAHNCGLDSFKNKCRSNSLKIKDPNVFFDDDKIAIRIYTPNVKLIRDRVVKEFGFPQNGYEIIEEDGCLEICAFKLGKNKNDANLGKMVYNYAILDENVWKNNHKSYLEKNTPLNTSNVFFEKAVKSTIEEFVKAIKKDG